MMNFELGPIYLTVPFSEKDEAKKHGARWDPVVKRWWTHSNDIAANPGIHRWIIDNAALAGKAKDAFEFVKRKALIPVRPSRPKPQATGQRTDFSPQDCACPSPPWEHCEHTRESAGGRFQTDSTNFGR